MYTTSTYDNPLVMPPSVRERYEFLETSSACAVMHAVCPAEWADILSVLDAYALDPATWMKPGGNRGDVAKEIDSLFEKRDWHERRLDIETYGYLVDGKGVRTHIFEPLFQEGYLVDNFKGRIAVDVEWNAKDGNLDRDMTAYRTWHGSGVLTAGVIITKHQQSLKSLVRRLWDQWNATLPPDERNNKLPIDMGTSTTTNFEKAGLRVRRGVMGTCPLLIVGLSEKSWSGEPYRTPTVDSSASGA
jgi:hypothetical protein